MVNPKPRDMLSAIPLLSPIGKSLGINSTNMKPPAAVHMVLYRGHPLVQTSHLSLLPSNTLSWAVLCIAWQAKSKLLAQLHNSKTPEERIKALRNLGLLQEKSCPKSSGSGTEILAPSVEAQTHEEFSAAGKQRSALNNAALASVVKAASPENSWVNNQRKLPRELKGEAAGEIRGTSNMQQGPSHVHTLPCKNTNEGDKRLYKGSNNAHSSTCSQSPPIPTYHCHQRRHISDEEPSNDLFAEDFLISPPSPGAIVAVTRGSNRRVGKVKEKTKGGNMNDPVYRVKMKARHGCRSGRGVGHVMITRNQVGSSAVAVAARREFGSPLETKWTSWMRSGRQEWEIKDGAPGLQCQHHSLGNNYRKILQGESRESNAERSMCRKRVALSSHKSPALEVLLPTAPIQQLYHLQGEACPPAKLVGDVPYQDLHVLDALCNDDHLLPSGNCGDLDGGPIKTSKRDDRSGRTHYSMTRYKSTDKSGRMGRSRVVSGCGTEEAGDFRAISEKWSSGVRLPDSNGNQEVGQSGDDKKTEENFSQSTQPQTPPQCRQPPLASVGVKKDAKGRSQVDSHSKRVDATLRGDNQGGREKWKLQERGSLKQTTEVFDQEHELQRDRETMLRVGDEGARTSLPKGGHLFQGLSFILTGFTRRKAVRLGSMITSSGGLVLDRMPPQLSVPSLHHAHSGTTNEAPTSPALTSTVVVISRPGASRRLKYVLAIAKGCPLLHHFWVEDSVARGQAVSARAYVLPGACVTSTEGDNMGTGMLGHGQREGAIMAVAEANPGPRKPLKGMSIGVVHYLEACREWMSVLEAGGAASVQEISYSAGLRSRGVAPVSGCAMGKSTSVWNDQKLAEVIQGLDCLICDYPSMWSSTGYMSPSPDPQQAPVEEGIGAGFNRDWLKGQEGFQGEGQPVTPEMKRRSSTVGSASVLPKDTLYSFMSRAVATARREEVPVVSLDWAAQCLAQGVRLSFKSCKRFTEPFSGLPLTSSLLSPMEIGGRSGTPHFSWTSPAVASTSTWMHPVVGPRAQDSSPSTMLPSWVCGGTRYEAGDLVCFRKHATPLVGCSDLSHQTCGEVEGSLWTRGSTGRGAFGVGRIEGFFCTTDAGTARAGDSSCCNFVQMEPMVVGVTEGVQGLQSKVGTRDCLGSGNLQRESQRDAPRTLSSGMLGSRDSDSTEGAVVRVRVAVHCLVGRVVGIGREEFMSRMGYCGRDPNVFLLC
ncbi:unnamed protein product [Choristocarpus tenellus]